jgi:hypothetical protein
MTKNNSLILSMVFVMVPRCLTLSFEISTLLNFTISVQSVVVPSVDLTANCITQSWKDSIAANNQAFFQEQYRVR